MTSVSNGQTSRYKRKETRENVSGLVAYCCNLIPHPGEEIVLVIFLSKPNCLVIALFPFLETSDHSDMEERVRRLNEELERQKKKAEALERKKRKLKRSAMRKEAIKLEIEIQVCSQTLFEIFHTAKNTIALLQVVNFIGFLQFVNKLQQTCTLLITCSRFPKCV